MFAKTIVLFPVLAIAAVAQSKEGYEPLPDRVVLQSSDQLTVVSYGNELKGGAMSLDITANVDDDGAQATIAVTGGQPFMPMTLTVSFAEARIDLSPLGIKSWLLVDPVAFSATVQLDAAGEYHVAFDVTGKDLAGKKICLQAMAIEKHSDGYELRMSQGLCFDSDSQSPAPAGAWQPAKLEEITLTAGK